MPHIPRLPPANVVPHDLILKASQPIRRGRPKRINVPQESDKPGSTADPFLASSVPSASSDYPEQQEVEITPPGSPARPHAPTVSSDGEADSPCPPADRDPINAEFQQWADSFHQKRDQFISGHISAPSSHSKQATWSQLLPDHSVTPGVQVIHRFLQASSLHEDDPASYVEKLVNVDDIIQEFDRLPNDYTLRTHHISSHARLQWLEGPGPTPSDIRARRFKIHIDPKHLTRSADMIVWRVVYYCNQACRSEPFADDSNGRFLTFAEQIVQHAIKVTRPGTVSETPSRKRPPRMAAVAGRKRTKDSIASRSAGETSEAEPGGDEECDGKGVAMEKQPSSAVRTPISNGASPTKKGIPRVCRAKIIVRMTVRQALEGKCTFTVRRPERHSPQPTGSPLRISPSIRRLLHEAASSFATTQSTVKAWYTTKVVPSHAHVQWLKDTQPRRLPTNKDFRTAVVTAQRQSRLDFSPLASIEILATRHPGAFLQWVSVPPTTTIQRPKFIIARSRFPKLLDPEGPNEFDRSSRFECVIATPHSLVTAIAFISRYGLYMDSSWRNKNAFRCPLTMLATIDHNHRMVPLATMVSNHADEEAYTWLLKTFRDGMVDAARDVLGGHIKPSIEGVGQEEILEACRAIELDGTVPAFLMIDNDDAERLAFLKVFPNAPIRICQFHFMQACRSKARRIFARSSNSDGKAQAFMEAIRRCQRCPSAALWRKYYADLAKEVNEIAGDKGQAWGFLSDWLSREWFAPRTREALVDYGLPRHVTRDGPWSTNNYSEAAFRTFDRVFLNSRANRRVDRLISILLVVYFPYYELHQKQDMRANAQLQNSLFDALYRWEMDCIRECPVQAVRAGRRTRYATAYCVYTPRNGRRSTGQPHYCGLSQDDREICDCDEFEQTGKRCSHLWTMVVFELCGPVLDFQENAAAIQDFLQGIASNEHLQASVRGEDPQDQGDDDRQDYVSFWKEEVNHFTDFPPLYIQLETGTPRHSSPRLANSARSNRIQSTGMIPKGGVLAALAQRRTASAQTPEMESPTTASQASAIPLGETARPSPSLSENKPNDPSPWIDDASDQQRDPGRDREVTPIGRRSQVRIDQDPIGRQSEVTEPFDSVSKPVACPLCGCHMPSSDFLRHVNRQHNSERAGDSLSLDSSVNTSVASPAPQASEALVQEEEPPLPETGYQYFEESTVASDVNTGNRSISPPVAPNADSNDCEHLNEPQMDSVRHHKAESPQAFDFSGLSDTLERTGPDSFSRPQGAAGLTSGTRPSTAHHWMTDTAASAASIDGPSETVRLPVTIGQTVESPRLGIRFHGPPPKVQPLHPNRSSGPPVRRKVTASSLRASNKKVQGPPEQCCDGDNDSEEEDVLSAFFCPRAGFTGAFLEVFCRQADMAAAIVRSAMPSRHPIIHELIQCVRTQQPLHRILGIRQFLQKMQMEPFVWEARHLPLFVNAITKFLDSSLRRGHEVVFTSLFRATHDRMCTLCHKPSRYSLGNVFVPRVDPDGTADNSVQRLVQTACRDAFAAAKKTPCTTANCPGSYATSHRCGNRQLPRVLVVSVRDVLGDHSRPQLAEMVDLNIVLDTPQPYTLIGAIADNRSMIKGESKFASVVLRNSVWWVSNGVCTTRLDIDPRHGWFKTNQLASPSLLIYTSKASVEPGNAQPVGKHTARQAVRMEHSVRPVSHPVPVIRPPSTRISARKFTRKARVVTPISDDEGSTPSDVYTGSSDDSSSSGDSFEVMDDEATDFESRYRGSIEIESARFPSAGGENDLSVGAARWEHAIMWTDRRGHVPLTMCTPQFSSLSVVKTALPTMLSDAQRYPTGPGLHFTNLEIGHDSYVLLEDLRSQCDTSSWYNNLFIDSVARATLQQDGLGMFSNIQYIPSLIGWHFRLKRPLLRQPGVPWPRLGADQSWRNKITLSVISTSWNSHFALLAIIGPQKLVVPIDGARGRYDHPDLQKKWTRLLADRLIWEEEQGMVSRDDNEGWTFLDNSKATHQMLHWISQDDSHMCGPLALAAAILFMYRTKPTAGMLGIVTADGSYSAEAGATLRESLIAHVLGCARSVIARQDGLAAEGWHEEGVIWSTIAQWKHEAGLHRA